VFAYPATNSDKVTYNDERRNQCRLRVIFEDDTDAVKAPGFLVLVLNVLVCFAASIHRIGYIERFLQGTSIHVACYEDALFYLWQKRPSVGVSVTHCCHNSMTQATV